MILHEFFNICSLFVFIIFDDWCYLPTDLSEKRVQSFDNLWEFLIYFRFYLLQF